MTQNDWTAALEATGRGILRGLLPGLECAAIAALYEEPTRFRSKVVMARMRHGVSEVRKGQRHTLGIIFHDAT